VKTQREKIEHAVDLLTAHIRTVMSNPTHDSAPLIDETRRLAVGAIERMLSPISDPFEGTPR